MLHNLKMPCQEPQPSLLPPFTFLELSTLLLEDSSHSSTVTISGLLECIFMLQYTCSSIFHVPQWPRKRWLSYYNLLRPGPNIVVSDQEYYRPMYYVSKYLKFMIDPASKVLSKMYSISLPWQVYFNRHKNLKIHVELWFYVTGNKQDIKDNRI